METLADASKFNLARGCLQALINTSFPAPVSLPEEILRKPDQRRENMENNVANSGLGAVVCAGENSTQSNLWRPWNTTEGKTAQLTTRSVQGEISSVRPKIQQVIHPVKLFWPKSRCFDYLYRDAETLLRNYPVQATICPYEDSSSDEDGEDDDGEEEEVVGKEPN